MALIKCPECGADISDMSEKCIHCGYPLTTPSDDDKDNIDDTIEKNLVPTDIDAIQSKQSRKKKVIICCVAIVIVFGLVFAIISSVKNSFSADEKTALRVVEKYQDMLKDPDSLVLRSDVIVIRAYSDDEYHTFCYFTASGNNSYGASVTSTSCFLDGKYFCDTDEFPESSELSEMDKEEALQYLIVQQHLLLWNLYGNSLADTNESVIESYSVDANKIARKLGIEANVK